MPIALQKDSIDLGIVITDSERSLAFYRDALGLDHVADTPMPGPMQGTMHRLRCGTSMVKLVRLDEVPTAHPAPGGIAGATGFRYFTISVANLDEATRACRDAGANVLFDGVELPGLRVSMIEDPDGNWVELIHRDD